MPIRSTPAATLDSVIEGGGKDKATTHGAGLDTQDREHAVLRTSQSLLASALDALQVGYLTRNRLDGSCFFNRRFADIWNIPLAQHFAVDAASLNAHMAARVKDPNGLLSQMEREWLDPATECRSVVELEHGLVLERQAIAQYIDGNCVGLAITFRDITGILRSEERMEFDHRVLENAGPMLWIDVATGRVIYANPAAHEHLGYSPEDLRGLRIDEYDMDIRPGDLFALRETLTLAKRPVTLEGRHRRKDGSFRDVEAAIFLANAAEGPIFITSVKDTTRQKRAELERKRQDATLEALINSIPDRIFYKNLEGRYLGCNTAFAAAIGRSAESIRGLTTYDLFPKDVAQDMVEWQNFVLSQSKEASREVWVTYPDGRKLLFETKISPLWDEEGHARGVLGVSRDITERRRAEEEVHHAKELAEEATRVKSDFLANMSHEIRTPLNAIIGLSHLVLKTDLTPRQRDYIDKVQSSGQHLLGVVNDILDFSKVEAGRLDLECTEFELEQLLDNTGNLVSEKCHAKALELVFDVAPDVPRQLVGDALRLGQILLNYVNNAVKFTDAGEVVISVRASERTDNDVLLCFRVRDTGIGLSQDQVSRLFRSFSQADASVTRKFGGTGLGLAISKRLAELMGGEVGVESEPGKGSTFWFSARLGIAVARRKLVTMPELRGRRALVVDDNSHARAVIVDMLEEMTFITSEASSGEEAVGDVLRASRSGHPYDVVYVDWRMPGIDGIETARRIHSLELPSPPMLLMVTAYGAEEIAKGAAAAGIRNVLVKPVNASVLFDSTMAVLGAPMGGAAKFAELPKNPASQRLADLRGARILLVEDNDINQQVAREMLEDASLVVEIADNGEMALEMARRSVFDLVFMDMQMPVMDGVTAARELRRIEALKHLPIVAMTANAMEQHRRECMDAGMNDFLVKPIDPNELQEILLRWIRPSRVSAPAAKAQRACITPSTVHGVLPEGIEGLDTTLGLRRMLGKQSLYLAMLERYVAGQRPVMDDMRVALAASDRATIERLAHTTKAVSGNIGATMVQEHAATLEMAIREGCSTSRIEQLVDQLEAPLRDLLDALSAFLKS